MKKLFSIIMVAMSLVSVAGSVEDVTAQEEATTVVVGTVYDATAEGLIFEVEGQLYEALWNEPQTVEVGELYTITFSGDELVAADKV